MSTYINFNFPINRETIDFLYNKNISLDQLLYLKCIQENSVEILNNLFTDTTYQNKVVLLSIMRGYVKNNHILTKSGEQLLALYNFLTNDNSGFQQDTSIKLDIPQKDKQESVDKLMKQLREAPINIVAKQVITTRNNEPYEEEFKELWNIFPLTDSWIMRGFKLPQNRTLRNSKNMCYERYCKILNDKKNTLSHRDIMNALKFEIWHRKKISTGTKNEMTYMQGITTWLNQRSFEGYYEQWIEYQNTHKQIDFNEFSENSVGNNTFVKRLV